MRLLETDPIEVIRGLFPSAVPVTFLDVGANQGLVSRRILDIFPDATVHAFEPSPDMFPHLQRRASAHPGIVAHQLAVGARDGEATMHITQNPLLSSLLPMCADGMLAYGEAGGWSRAVKVRCVRLDEWAASEGVARVEAMKIDVQGLELEVLRGATRLLQNGVICVMSEAQLVPEYEGAATFSQIDQFLNSLGFVLYQMHEVHHKGRDSRAMSCDALWVRRDAIPAHEPPISLADMQASYRERVGQALSECDSAGLRRVAIYGAGRHTRALGETLASPPVSIVCVIDDAPSLEGDTLWGFPIVGAARALTMDLDAIVLSSNTREADMWAKTGAFRDKGVRVLRLYGHDPINTPAQTRCSAAPLG